MFAYKSQRVDESYEDYMNRLEKRVVRNYFIVAAVVVVAVIACIAVEK